MKIGSRQNTGRNRAWGGYETAYSSNIQIQSRAWAKDFRFSIEMMAAEPALPRQLLVKARETSAFCWLEAYNITGLYVYVRCKSLNAWVFALDLAQISYGDAKYAIRLGYHVMIAKIKPCPPSSRSTLSKSP